MIKRLAALALFLIASPLSAGYFWRNSFYTGATSATGWTRSNPNVYLTNTGDNVGIGTAVPYSKLDVIGDVTFSNSPGPVDRYINFNMGGSPQGFIHWRFYSSGSENAGLDLNRQLKIEQTSGNVGISTMAPQALFHIGPAVFVVTSAGNVGIGNTGPTEKLVVTGNQTISGTVTRYNLDTTVSNGLASIVGAVEATGQAGSIGSTTLFTTPAKGVYRLTVYMICSNSSAVATVQTNLAWTDSIQAQTAIPGGTLSLATVGNYLQATFVFETAASTNINYSTTLAGGGKYSVYLQLERLK